jgi:hypothetical protein
MLVVGIHLFRDNRLGSFHRSQFRRHPPRRADIPQNVSGAGLVSPTAISSGRVIGRAEPQRSAIVDGPRAVRRTESTAIGLSGYHRPWSGRTT